MTDPETENKPDGEPTPDQQPAATPPEEEKKEDFCDVEIVDLALKRSEFSEGIDLDDQ